MRVLADARAWSSTIKAARARFAHAKAWMAVDVSDKGAKNFRGFDSLVDFLEWLVVEILHRQMKTQAVYKRCTSRCKQS